MAIVYLLNFPCSFSSLMCCALLCFSSSSVCCWK